MAGATKSDDITEQTWTLETEGIYAVAFIDAEQQAGVLLTCGDMQCADLETAVVLAGVLQRHLDRLTSAPVGSKTEVNDAEAGAVRLAEPDDDDDDEPSGQTQRQGGPK